jgi:hypothetical protein
VAGDALVVLGGKLAVSGDTGQRELRPAVNEFSVSLKLSFVEEGVLSRSVIAPFPSNVADWGCGCWPRK